MTQRIALIPAYEPDGKLLSLLAQAKEAGFSPVVVNDGSGMAYESIFKQAARFGTVLSYTQNHGKGYALKLGLSYIQENEALPRTVVTLDADGQHTVEDARRVCAAAEKAPDALVWGSRRFDRKTVPLRSRLGNRITLGVYRLATGRKLQDTQTGLRGIPRTFMKELLDVPGERFEFETQMLLESAGNYPIIEVPIRTIYDSKENHQTHFNTLTDSVKIYRILGKKFMKYVFSSFSSCVLDLVLFTIFCSMFKGRTGNYIAVSTVLARVISATCNYALNYKVVFESRKKVHTSGVRYLILALIQMGLSALLVTGGCGLLPTVPEVAVKVVVDGVLFFISYAVQQRYVF